MQGFVGHPRLGVLLIQTTHQTPLLFPHPQPSIDLKQLLMAAPCLLEVYYDFPFHKDMVNLSFWGDLTLSNT